MTEIVWNNLYNQAIDHQTHLPGLIKWWDRFLARKRGGVNTIHQVKCTLDLFFGRAEYSPNCHHSIYEKEIPFQRLGVLQYINAYIKCPRYQIWDRFVYFGMRKPLPGCNRHCQDSNLNLNLNLHLPVLLLEVPNLHLISSTIEVVEDPMHLGH